MVNSLIVMRDGGDVQGEIQDKVFNFQSGGLGVTSTPVDDVAEINLGLFSGDSPDQMLLTDQSELRGRFVSPSVTIKLSFNSQIKSIPPASIKTVMVHNDIDN